MFIRFFSLHFLHRHLWYNGPNCLFDPIFLSFGSLGAQEWETFLRALPSSLLDLGMYLDSMHPFVPFSLLYLVFPSLALVCCAFTHCSPCFQSFIQAPGLFSLKSLLFYSLASNVKCLLSGSPYLLGQRPTYSGWQLKSFIHRLQSTFQHHCPQLQNYRS